MNRLFCIILLFYANTCLGQVLPSDSLKLKIAQEFLKKRLGDKIVREKVAFAGVYEGMLDLVTFELKGQKENNKNLIVVFFDGEEVESKFNTKISKRDIRNFYNGKQAKNLFLNSAYTDKLGKELSFEKGIKGWEIKLEGLVNNLSWNIYSYSNEKWGPYEAGGNVLKINAQNGEYKITDWSEIE